MDIKLIRLAENRMWRTEEVKSEIADVLGLVVAEWKSDPTSTQCFDLRVVEKAKQLMAEYDQLRATSPHWF